MSKEERLDDLRNASGNISYSDTLTTFLYLLIRDHLSAGRVEQILIDSIRNEKSVNFTNGFLAKYADNLASKIKDHSKNTLTESLKDVFKQTEKEKLTRIELENKKKKETRGVKLIEDDNQLTELQDKVGPTILNAPEEELIKVDQDIDDTMKRDADVIVASFEAIDNLKRIVSTDNVSQVVDILKNQVSIDLSDDMKKRLNVKEESTESKLEKVQAEHDNYRGTLDTVKFGGDLDKSSESKLQSDLSSGGVFRRVK